MARTAGGLPPSTTCKHSCVVHLRVGPPAHTHTVRLDKGLRVAGVGVACRHTRTQQTHRTALSAGACHVGWLVNHTGGDTWHTTVSRLCRYSTRWGVAVSICMSCQPCPDGLLAYHRDSSSGAEGQVIVWKHNTDNYLHKATHRQCFCLAA